MGPSNYIWYQNRFTERVRDVYDKNGIEFVQRVRDTLPRDDNSELLNDALLWKLESISPGFIAWALLSRRPGSTARVIHGAGRRRYW